MGLFCLEHRWGLLGGRLDTSTAAPGTVVVAAPGCEKGRGAHLQSQAPPTSQAQPWDTHGPLSPHQPPCPPLCVQRRHRSPLAAQPRHVQLSGDRGAAPSAQRRLWPGACRPLRTSTLLRGHCVLTWVLSRTSRPEATACHNCVDSVTQNRPAPLSSGEGTDPCVSESSGRLPTPPATSAA